MSGQPNRLMRHKPTLHTAKYMPEINHQKYISNNQSIISKPCFLFPLKFFKMKKITPSPDNITTIRNKYLTPLSPGDLFITQRIC